MVGTRDRGKRITCVDPGNSDDPEGERWFALAGLRLRHGARPNKSDRTTDEGIAYVEG